MGHEIAWQKSSFSSGGDAANCVEVGRQKSTFSGGDDDAHCVELAAHQPLLLRENDEPGTVIATSGTGLAALIRHLRAG
ncbi:DUF397 domain-containing protein [Streptomyces sp. NPDC006365]|uniref:DUF397 domain-containing protein n=1 Tax=Streptomyces sp. NPDC006365 TaxID=3364744 RepID=UPI0036AF275C